MADIRIIETPEDFFLYDTWVKAHPQGSLWQSLEWKRYQEALGREVMVYVTEGIASCETRATSDEARSSYIASAMVVIDRTTGEWSTWDIPRGPLRATSYETRATGLLDRVVADAKNNRCCALYISPPRELPPLEARSSKLEASCRHEQPSATRMIDLTPSEHAILAQMHPKGRYNIHIAQKHGVRVEESRDIDAFYALLRETAERDGFRILPLKAYKTFLECLPGSFLLMAYSPPPPAPPPFAGEGSSPSPPQGGRGQGMGAFFRKEEIGGGGKMGTTPIAGLLGVIWGKTGVYYYGASSYAHRALMAPYALQLEAMRRCKGKGCAMYDLMGVVVPDPLSLTLPPRGMGFSHPWAGVSAFKEKFGGMVVTYPPEQQIILRPVLWRVLQWKRGVIG